MQVPGTAFKMWWVRSWWPGGDVGCVEAYLRDIAGLQPDGTLHPVPDSADAARALAALRSEHRDYRKVKAPALTIFSETFLPAVGKDSATSVVLKAWEARHFASFRIASQARIRQELQQPQMVTVAGSHGSFAFASRDSVAVAMKRFLLGRRGVKSTNG